MGSPMVWSFRPLTIGQTVATSHVPSSSWDNRNMPRCGGGMSGFSGIWWSTDRVGGICGASSSQSTVPYSFWIQSGTSLGSFWVEILISVSSFICCIVAKYSSLIWSCLSSCHDCAYSRPPHTPAALTCSNGPHMYPRSYTWTRS